MLVGGGSSLWWWRDMSWEWSGCASNKYAKKTFNPNQMRSRQVQWMVILKRQKKLLHPQIP